MEVVLDRARTDEQLSRDLSVRVSLCDEAGDLRLLRRQLAKGIGGSSPNMLASRFQFNACTFGERLHPEVGEEVVRCPQLSSCIDEPALTSQPFTEEQVCTGEINRDPSPTESFNRLDVERLGSMIVCA